MTDSARRIPEQDSLVGKLMWFFLNNPLMVVLLVAALVFGGILVAPFDWRLGGISRHPIAVDAIPDIGENQQIIFTQWPGRSPQDVEDQISYPLSIQLMGIPGVSTVRTISMFGFSTIYVIFHEDVEFYWSRTRILEKLASLPAGTLPSGAKPALGPDATALGQIFWYTLEGRDPKGNVTGGWDQEELRSLQDWYVRYWLASAQGVAEVASIGGYVREYQVDLDPDAMLAWGVTMDQVYRAVQAANLDVGARSMELNRVEYFIRGVGFIKSLDDIRNSVVRAGADGVPVLVSNVAAVSLGPAARRGALDSNGAPAVGGVVVARYGSNPLQVISNVKKRIGETIDSMPVKAVFRDGTNRSEMEAFAQRQGFSGLDSHGKPDQRAWQTWLKTAPQDQWPEWVTLSRVTVVPFYDRTGLIHETIATLDDAISLEILVTVLVVLVMLMHLRSGFLISLMLPLTVLLSFIAMKFFNVQANIVALSGIAIAIGTIVDMGIVICENILNHLSEARERTEKGEQDEPVITVVHRAASEVGAAVLTAVLTTVVSFLPVFTMTGPEGKLFRPLAFTKTFALLASVLTALIVLPPAAAFLFGFRKSRSKGVKVSEFVVKWSHLLLTGAVLGLVTYHLSVQWEPLGPATGTGGNLLFLLIVIGGLLGFFRLFQYFYPRLLGWCLDHKLLFLALPSILLALGLAVWLGAATLLEPIRDHLPKSLVTSLDRSFPGLGKEFMPDLDEGSFLFMPTTMTHASIGEALDVLRKQDLAIGAIPEVEMVTGKLGRAETPLDPAPISMFETVINYKSEYMTDSSGRRLLFRYEKGSFLRDPAGSLIPHDKGRPFRQWRDHIRTTDDIWNEILRAAAIPGTTSAPKLQPIAARLVMLQSGMRAPMGLKVRGPDLQTIEKVALDLEALLRQAPGVEPATVIADRMVGKPYLEIRPRRDALARYGIPVARFQESLEIAVGGKTVTSTIEGRERFPVRLRYSREQRDSLEALDRVLVPAMGGRQIPLSQLADIEYVRGPQMIRSENAFLQGFVVFDKKPGMAEVDVVEQCRAFLDEKIRSGELIVPAGVSYIFAGNYENQQRAAQTLSLVLPIALFLIFLLIYFQFSSLATTLLIFTGVFVAWSGGFILIWLYGQPWFLDFSFLGRSLRDLFQIHPINLSVAVWVGFLALFGIATDDGVVMGTYLTQRFAGVLPGSRDQIRRMVVEAGSRRVRACLMTTATTILALLPVLTSTGRGSDVMVPMAIPSFGGMLIEIFTMLVVPVLFSLIMEIRLSRAGAKSVRLDQ